eukprot:g20078.t1
MSRSGGIASARALFESDDPKKWMAALIEYRPGIIGRNKEELNDLEQFLTDKYARELAWALHNTTKTQQEKRGLQPAQLSKVVQWKLKKGTFRPGLLQKAESNSAEKIREAWRGATTELVNGLQEIAGDKLKYPEEAGNIRTSGELEQMNAAVVSAIKTLDKNLFGVGPATASALLAPVFPEFAAFMSDEALLGCGLFSSKADLKYDAKTYSRFNQLLFAKAEKLAEHDDA